MKKLLTSFLLLFASVIFLQAQNFPEDGAIYRLTNTARNYAVLVEDYLTNNLVGGAENSLCNDLWKFTKSDEGWNIQNVLTERYIQNETGFEVIYRTNVTPEKFIVKRNSNFAEKFYNIININATNGIHCASHDRIVPYYPATSKLEGSEWTFEKVTVSDEQIQEARKKVNEFILVYKNQERVKDIYLSHFEDAACTILKSEYQSMSDEELAASLDSCGSELAAIAQKIKNDTWATREKEYRVATYAPYSDPDYWANKLNTFAYSWLNNPTGICASGGDVLYIFVGKEPKDGATLEIDAIIDNNSTGTRTTLKKGLNIIPVTGKDLTYFIVYTVNSKKDYLIADFDSIPIHIEGGYVNGYWDKVRHTDEDWVDITRNLAKHKNIFVKGDNIMFFMNRELIISDNICPNTISDAIGWWDNMVKWQQEIMGFEDIRPSKFNNRICAVSYAGDGLMSATWHQTNYVETCLFEILPYKKIMEKSGFCWGPSHEVGHVHQGAINMIGCSEASNNLFSNLSVYKLGKFVTSGDAVIKNMANYYGNKTPWSLQDIGAKMRMYWQLYLYYHVAGHDTLFYPKLFKLLREDPMKKTAGGTINHGRYDLLHFAQKCCEASGEDMTNFFEAWGFFHTMSKEVISDYGDYTISSTSSMIRDAKKAMAKYPKKAGAIEFIEDRAAPSLRTDGGDGYKLEYVAGKYAEMGQYTAYYADSIDIIANGYVYTKSGNKLTFSEGKNAVGFKIYDADSTLITFTNFHNIELSNETAKKDIIIVAVSANGTEVTVKDKRDGTEEQQLEVLKEALSVAETILSYKDVSGKKVGYYFESTLVTMNEIVESVKNVIKNNDQSAHTYGEWAKIIDNEIMYLNTAENTRVKIYPGNVYKLTNVYYLNYSMYYENSGKITCKAGTANPKSRQFTFTSTGQENEFYISTNGKYIDFIGRSRQATAITTKKSEAVKFTVGEHGIGKLYMYKTGDTGLGLHCDQYKNVVGWNHTESPTLWNIICVTQNKESADEKELNSLVNDAISIHDLVVDTLNLGSTSFYDWVEVTSETLSSDVDSMMSLVAESENVISKKYYNEYTSLIDKLKAIISVVKSGYTIPTGINGIIFDEKNVVIYDSRGRRVNKITSSGIYIIDGKKMYISK
ncbi:MAG: M60 family metallopeptidase [Bacteroidaceae bacterium]|nr:M60 family metallopeptidase [Bacteroidaceae bacterium]